MNRGTLYAIIEHNDDEDTKHTRSTPVLINSITPYNSAIILEY